MNTAHARDLALVRRALAGDELAREELTRRVACIPRIIAHRNQKLGAGLPSQELEDVSSDTLEVFWRRLPSFEGRAALETWIFRIACNVHLSALRKHDHHKTQDLPDEGLPDPTPISRAEEHSALHRGLSKLSPEDEQLLRLRHYESQSFVAIARELGLSPSGTKHRYRVALERLRSAMARDDSRGPAPPRP